VRVPLSWLKDFVTLPEPPEQVAHVLSFLGLVVEGAEAVPAPFERVVVARVLATRPHPGADRVQLVDVDAGEGEPLQVVCGAFNMRPGDLVPLATVGAQMPDGREIARRKVRGEWSNGMLCSAAELGLGPEGTEPAIYILPPGAAAPGEAFSEVFGFGADVVFDLEISPNRGDCFSVVGVARDLAAALARPLVLSAPPRAVTEGVAPANVAVDAGAEDLCPRFTGTVIEDVREARISPMVARRLTLAGMRPINPLVDVSNYVMLELGQPNHPYDLSRLGGRGLLVRRAKAGEKLVTLDGVERELSGEDLVISDANGRPVGLAGIMGGAGSGVSASTDAVLLEVANFDPQAVAATGKRTGVVSEARTRFERGVDIELPERAIDRFVELLGPSVRRGPTTDVRSRPPMDNRVALRPGRANLVLGTSLSPERCVAYLERLGFCLASEGGDELVFRVPSWRGDVTREIDLIEEVARMYGYENIGRSLPARPARAGRLAPWQLARRRLREALVGAGASEAWTSSFVSTDELRAAGLDPATAVEVANPLDASQALLRTSLLPGLVRAARHNLERQAEALCLFELGDVFSTAVGGAAGTAGPFEHSPVEGAHEWEQLGLIAVGTGADGAYAARIWEVIASALRLEDATVSARPGRFSDEPAALGAASALGALHPGRRGVISTGRGPRAAGVLGELAPEVAARNGLTGRVAVLIADLAPLLGHGAGPLSAKPVSRYPAVDLDVALVVGEDWPAGEVWATVRQAAGELAEHVVLFDVWRGPSLGGGRRSLAFRARLRAPDRTLTEADVAEVRARVVQAARERHGAELRGAG
jgi:phenylalanyl-tRNA synthetase beta chain